MNTLPKQIQTLIFRYIHQDALHNGFKEVFPIYATTSPFSMDRIRFNEISDHGIEECTRFKSDMCLMCYARNMSGERSLHVWIRCSDILSGLEDFTILNGEVFETVIFHGNDITTPPLYKLKLLPKRAGMDVTKGCLYSQMFYLYEWELRGNTVGVGLENFVPLYEQ